MILTYCVDDQKMWRDLLEDAIKDAGIKDYRVFATAGDVLRNLNEDVYICIIDHRLGEGVTGLDLLRTVTNRLPECLCLILSATDDARVVIEYLNEGAWRWIVKDSETTLTNVTNYLKEALILAEKSKKRSELIKRLTS